VFVYNIQIKVFVLYKNRTDLMISHIKHAKLKVTREGVWNISCW